MWRRREARKVLNERKRKHEQKVAEQKREREKQRREMAAIKIQTKG